VFPEPVIAQEASLPFMVCMPVISGSLIDWIWFPLEPPVQGRKHHTAQAGDLYFLYAFQSTILYYAWLPILAGVACEMFVDQRRSHNVDSVHELTLPF